MNIGLNLLHARPTIGGGWNYIKNIVETLGELDDMNQYWCYCNSFSEGLVPDRANFRKSVSGGWAINQPARVIMENTLLQLRAVRDGLDLIHWFANTRSIASGVKSVVTIHDLGVFDLNKKVGRLIQHTYMRMMLPFSARYATVLAPVSHVTEDALVRRFAIDRSRCVVIPNPIHSTYAPATNESVIDLRRTSSLPTRFWLYVAHYYPHKNHCKLFDAYREYQSRVPENWPLVLRGERNGADALLEKQLRNAGIHDNVIWLPRLRQDEMPALYTAATALVFPSLYEGGGMPVMEAMACGCPLIASDIPTTREFAGEAALLFDPNDTGDIVEKMLMFASDDALRAKHRVCGFMKVARLRKEIIISNILQAYTQAKNYK